MLIDALGENLSASMRNFPVHTPLLTHPEAATSIHVVS